MLQKFKKSFNAIKDIEEVCPNLALDINVSLQTGQVNGTAQPLEYSKETNTGEVGNYIRDNIDVLQAQKSLKASMAAEKSANATGSAEKSTQSGENA